MSANYLHSHLRDTQEIKRKKNSFERQAAIIRVYAEDLPTFAVASLMVHLL